MGSARRLLLVAALALAITTADARLESPVSPLTLSPSSDTLISGRSDSNSTPPKNFVIGSAASDTAPKTPATTAPTSSSSDVSSEASSPSGSGSESQEATDAPSSASATVSPDTSDRSTTPDTESQSSNTGASKSSASKSTATADTLNDSRGTLSSGESSGFNATTGVPIIFGALACVGAIVMAVTYKKKRDADASANDPRPSSDCEYTNGANFTPDNRVLTTVHEDTPPLAVKVPSLGFQSSGSGAVADFTGTNSSVSLSSPFGSTRCKARVSSPVPSCYSTSEVNMEFQDTCPRHDEGSNVVLTIEEVAATGSSHVAPQVQL